MRIKPFILWLQGVFLFPVLPLRPEREPAALTGVITFKTTILCWAIIEIICSWLGAS